MKWCVVSGVLVVGWSGVLSVGWGVSDNIMSGLPVIQEKHNELLNTHLFLKLFVIFKHVLFDDRFTKRNTRQHDHLYSSHLHSPTMHHGYLKRKAVYVVTTTWRPS